MFAFGPKLIESSRSDGLTQLRDNGPLSASTRTQAKSDGLTQLRDNGPLVTHWVANLIYFPTSALFVALIAVPVGYFQLWRFRRRLEEPIDAPKPNPRQRGSHDSDRFLLARGQLA